MGLSAQNPTGLWRPHWGLWLLVKLSAQGSRPGHILSVGWLAPKERGQRKAWAMDVHVLLPKSPIILSHSSGETEWEGWRQSKIRSGMGFVPENNTSGLGKEILICVKHRGLERIYDLCRIIQQVDGSVKAEPQNYCIYLYQKENGAKTEWERPSNLLVLHLKRLRVGVAW